MLPPPPPTLDSNAVIVVLLLLFSSSNVDDFSLLLLSLVFIRQQFVQYSPCSNDVLTDRLKAYTVHTGCWVLSFWPCQFVSSHHFNVILGGGGGVMTSVSVLGTMTHSLCTCHFAKKLYCIISNITNYGDRLRGGHKFSLVIIGVCVMWQKQSKHYFH